MKLEDCEELCKMQIAFEIVEYNQNVLTGINLHLGCLFPQSEHIKQIVFTVFKTKSFSESCFASDLPVIIWM